MSPPESMLTIWQGGTEKDSSPRLERVTTAMLNKVRCDGERLSRLYLPQSGLSISPVSTRADTTGRAVVPSRYCISLLSQ